MSTAQSDLSNVVTQGFSKYVHTTKHNWCHIFAYSFRTLGFPYISKQIFKFLSIFQADLLQFLPVLSFLCQHQLSQCPTAPAVDLYFSSISSLDSISLFFGTSHSFLSLLILIDLRFVFNCFLKLQSSIFPLRTQVSLHFSSTQHKCCKRRD